MPNESPDRRLVHKLYLDDITKSYIDSKKKTDKRFFATHHNDNNRKDEKNIKNNISNKNNTTHWNSGISIKIYKMD